MYFIIHKVKKRRTVKYHYKQEILGNFQAAQSLSASFPWAVMYK